MQGTAGSGRARTRTRPALTVLLALVAAAACAKVAPPPGGAEDRDAPTIVQDALRPVPGTAGVGPADTVRIVFSERPDQRSVMRALRIWPDVDFRDVAWDGDTLTLTPDPAWAANRNTLLRIGTGAEDRRGNALESSFVLSFSTKDEPDSGEVAGRVWVGNEGDDVHPVVLVALDAADSLDTDVYPPHALAEADRSGHFRLRGLDTERAWRILALIDLDDDLVADRRGEVAALAPETVRFVPPENEVKIEDFLVGTLDSLGTIGGTVEADSGAVVFVRAIPDSPVAERQGAAEAEEEAEAEGKDEEVWQIDSPIGGGDFSLELPTGDVYRVSAFVDVDGDSAAAPSETQLAWEEPVSLRFTKSASGLRFDLRTPEPEENLELGVGREERDSAVGVETEEAEGAAGGGEGDNGDAPENENVSGEGEGTSGTEERPPGGDAAPEGEEGSGGGAR